MIPARGEGPPSELTQGLENVTQQDQQCRNTDLAKFQQSKQLQCLVEKYEHSLWQTEARRGQSCLPAQLPREPDLL